MSSPAKWWIGGKRLILTVTTGRSGTAYLCNLLDGLPNLCCKHEPEPQFASVMRAAQTNRAIAEDFLYNQKLPAILASAESTYFETGHLACKGFFEPLIEHGVTFDLVVLKRDAYKVATSLLQLGAVPARTPDGLKFLLSPNDSNVMRLQEWRDLPDWALCYWYCLEIARRMKNYSSMIQSLGQDVLRTSIEELHSQTGLTALLQFVGADNTRYRLELERKQRMILNDKEPLKNFAATKNLTAADMDEMAATVRSRVLQPLCFDGLIEK